MLNRKMFVLFFLMLVLMGLSLMPQAAQASCPPACPCPPQGYCQAQCHGNASCYASCSSGVRSCYNSLCSQCGLCCGWTP